MFAGLMIALGVLMFWGGASSSLHASDMGRSGASGMVTQICGSVVFVGGSVMLGIGYVIGYLSRLRRLIADKK